MLPSLVRSTSGCGDLRRAVEGLGRQAGGCDPALERAQRHGLVKGDGGPWHAGRDAAANSVGALPIVTWDPFGGPPLASLSVCGAAPHPELFLLQRVGEAGRPYPASTADDERFMLACLVEEEVRVAGGSARSRGQLLGESSKGRSAREW